MIREIYVLPINYFFPVNNTYVNTIKIIKICNFLNVKVEKKAKKLTDCIMQMRFLYFKNL